jgi:PII-like signaling protein
MGTWTVAERLMIFITETDRLDHQSLAERLVHEAHRHGLAGATAFRGFLSWGPGAHFHANRVLDLSNDLPVMVTVVDEPARIEAFAELAENLLERADCGALLTRESLQARQIGHRA